MKIIRYLDQHSIAHYASEAPDGTCCRIAGDVFGEFRVTGEKADVRKLLAPVMPTQILCIGLNYRRHAAEANAKVPERPILFVKGINALQHPGDPIEIPQHLCSTEVDYECELAVVIGKRCKNVSRKDALDYVLGYTCCNDVSARDHQIKLGGGQWCRGKFFDTFAPLGPRLVIVNRRTKEVTYTGLYYYLAHFSKFVRPGAVRIAANGRVPEVRSLAFEGSDGKVVVQLMNSGSATTSVQVSWRGKSFDLKLPRYSITTCEWLPDPGAKKQSSAAGE